MSLDPARLLWWSLVPLAVAAANVLLVVLMIRWFARPAGALSKELVGSTGTTLTGVSKKAGRVQVGSRTLIAISEESIDPGQAVRVVEIEGMVAKVAMAQ